MAISRVGAVANQTTDSTLTPSVISTIPAGIQSGDFCILALSVNRDVTVTQAPAGWAFLRRVEDTTTSKFDLYTRVSSGEGITATTTYSQPTAVACALISHVVAYRGVDTSTPFIAEAGTNETGTSVATHSAPTLTNTDAGAWGVFEAAVRLAGPTSWTVGAGLTELLDTDGGLATGNNLVALTADSNGPVPTGSVTYSGTNPAGSSLGVMWAGLLRPAAAADTIAPSVPGSVKATANGPTQATVSWAASTDAVGVASYRVQRGGTTVAAAVTGLSYVDTGLTPSTAYSYTVSAVDAAGNRSAVSAAATVTTPAAAADTTAPTKPGSFTATAASTTQINLSWTASTDAVGVTGYTITRNGTTVTTTATGTSYSDTGRAAGTTYSYTISAHDAAGNASATASASATTTAPPPPPPPTVTVMRVGPWSAPAAAALKQSHTAVARLDVWHAGKPVYTLDVVSGSVSAEAGRPVLRNMECTVIDPGGSMTGEDIESDLLSPYDCEVAPYRGVRVGGVDELTQLGVFGLTARQVNGDGSISLTGQDRAMAYQGPMSGSLAVSGGTPVETAIARLLGTRNTGVTMQSWVTRRTCGPLLYPADIDVWREALLLAQSVGGWLAHDRTGELVFAPTLPASARPVAVYAEGDGLLLSVDRSEDSDTIHNVVVVESAKTATGGVIRAVAEDTDPTSPTFAGGRYGRRVTTVTNPHVASYEQAQQVATTELVRELGRSETVAFTAVPDPARDVNEVVTVHSPRTGLIRRGLVVASVTMPLAVTEAMQVGVRKSILARDGQVLDEPIELTT